MRLRVRKSAPDPAPTVVNVYTPAADEAVDKAVARIEQAAEEGARQIENEKRKLLIAIGEARTVRSNLETSMVKARSRSRNGW